MGEAGPWLWRLPGEAGRFPRGEPDRRWVEAAAATGMLGRREASRWACAFAEEGGRFTGRPADWLRVATSGGVGSILSGAAGPGSVCAVGHAA